MIRIKRKKKDKINIKKVGKVGLPIVLMGAYITREIQTRKMLKKTIEKLDKQEEMNESVLTRAVDLCDLLESPYMEDDLYDYDLEDID